jgi:chorismate dehydratase
MLRIGQIDYANCVPIFSAFRHEHETEYEFVKGVPAQLNSLLISGGIDLCPSSSIEYARHADDYLLLPGLSISAIGPVQSVMLFSRQPLEELAGATIALSGESATSVILLKILLIRYYGYRTSFITTMEQDLTVLDQLPAVLLIGDAALRGVKAGTAPFVYDLGALWLAATGLPFVFALWMVRRDAVLRQAAAVTRCARALLAAKDVARNSHSLFAEQCAGEDFLSTAELSAYWEAISYDLTPEHQEGVRRFFADAVQIGALASAPELRYIALDP